MAEAKLTLGFNPDHFSFYNPFGAFTADASLKLPGLAGKGDDTIIAGGSRSLSVNIAAGGEGDDTLSGGGRLFNFNVLFGNQGDDWLFGDGGFNAIFGGEDDDYIEGGFGGNILFGDTLSLPVLDLAALQDWKIVFGTGLTPLGAGNDTIQGGSGAADLIVGGHGNDDIDAGDSYLNLVFGDAVSLGAGVQVDLAALIYTWDPNQALSVFSPFTLSGAGQDTIAGGSEIDVIFGGGGKDEIQGHEGYFDILMGNGGEDTIYGGRKGIGFSLGPDGFNAIIGGDDSDELYGGDEGNVIFGDSMQTEWSIPVDLWELMQGNLSLTAGIRPAGRGDDTIAGGTGNDLIVGGDGNDRIDTGDGYNLALGDGFFVQGSLAVSLAHLPQLASNPAAVLDFGVDLGLEGDGQDSIQGGLQADLFFGGDGEDTLRGSGSIDALFGNDGGDVLFGGEGVDYLRGGEGVDCLHGDSGVDFHFGGAWGDGFNFDQPGWEMIPFLATDFDPSTGDHHGCNAVMLNSWVISEDDSVTLVGQFASTWPRQFSEVQIDWADGSTSLVTVDPVTRTFSEYHQYLDDDPTGTDWDDYEVTVYPPPGSVAPPPNLALRSTIVTVYNVDPVIDTIDVTPAVIYEGDVTTLSGSFSDVGTLDDHRLDVDWDDNQVDLFVLVDQTAHTFSTQHRYLDNKNPDPLMDPPNDFIINAILIDDDRGSHLRTKTVTVRNVPPVIHDMTLDEANIFEDDVASLTVTFSDAGILDRHDVEVDWGDGTTTAVPSAPASGQRDVILSHQYLDDDPTDTLFDTYPILITVTDEDGDSDVSVTGVTVFNLDPVFADLSLDSFDVDENGFVTLFGTVFDVGTLDTHRVEIYWGDGTVEPVVPLVPGNRSFSRTHRYLDDDPTGTPSDPYVIDLLVTDDDMGFTTEALILTVHNVDPAIESLTLDAAVIRESDEVTLTGLFSDPGSWDFHSVHVEWGDGESTDLDLDPGARIFTVPHRYLDDDPSGTLWDEYAINVEISEAGAHNTLIAFLWRKSFSNNRAYA